MFKNILRLHRKITAPLLRCSARLHWGAAITYISRTAFEPRCRQCPSDVCLVAFCIDHCTQDIEAVAPQ